MKRLTLSLVLIFLTLMPLGAVSAQDAPPDGPIYIVQPGDSLWGIAHRLHLDYEALLTLNHITSSQVSPGTELLLPGLEGIQGFVRTETVSFGESLQSLSRRYQISEEDLMRLNRLTSPLELYAGVSFVVVGPEAGDGGAVTSGGWVTPAEGQSLLEMAVEESRNPWDLVSANSLTGTWEAVPGQVLYLPGAGDGGLGALPGEIRSVSFSPDQLVQGQTVVIQVAAPAGTQIEGSLNGHPLHFFSKSDGLFVALQGLHAMAETGLMPFSIQGQLPGGKPFAHRQMIPLASGEYPYRSIAGVPTETVDPELSGSETEKLAMNTTEVTPEKMWAGPLQIPMPEKYSNPGPFFGERRSFNGSGYYYYHSGLDFSTWGQEGIDIMAPAAGEVAFVGESIIYGNVTMLDHGWGVYTLYAHQSETLVEVGQQVERGHVIGRVGTTGRSTGPHLHWEVWVGGVQVDPQQWLENNYP